MRLMQAMLYVRDLPKMTAFYSATLGLPRVDNKATDGWVEFDAGGAQFALHAIPEEIAQRLEAETVPVKPREMNPLKLMFSVDDLEGEIQRLRSQGVTIAQRPWGAYYVVDPEGNILQICAACS